MTAILNAYVHLLSSTQSDFVWNRLPQQEKLIRTIVQKHKEENAFAIDDVAVNTKVFNNLLRHLRNSKYDQSMFNLLRHHSLVRPSKVQPQSKTGEVKEQREVNMVVKKTMKSINSKASANATLDNNSSGGGKWGVLKLSGSQHYSKLNEIFNLIQKGLYSKSLETFLIATKVILNDYKENGDIEFYPSNIGTLLRLMMNMWTPNQDRLFMIWRSIGLPVQLLNGDVVQLLGCSLKHQVRLNCILKMLLLAIVYFLVSHLNQQYLAVAKLTVEVFGYSK